MNTGNHGAAQGSNSPAHAQLTSAAEDLIEAIQAHANAMATLSESTLASAKTAIRSAVGEYSYAIENAWRHVSPFPLPETWREREGIAPKEIHLRATYHCQVLDANGLIAMAEQTGNSESISDTAEAAATLYHAHSWEPSEDSGLLFVALSYAASYERA